MLDGLDSDVAFLLVLTGRKDVKDQMLHTEARD